MGNHEIKLNVWKAGTNLVRVSVTEEGKLNSMMLVTVVDIEKIYVEGDGTLRTIYYNVHSMNDYKEDAHIFRADGEELMTLDGFLDRFKKEMLQKVWTDRELVDIYCATGVHEPKKRHKGKSKAERKAERKELKKELEINRIEEPTREEKIAFCHTMTNILKADIAQPYETLSDKDLEEVYSGFVDAEYNLRHEDKPKFQSYHVNDGGAEAQARREEEEDCESDC